MRTSPSLAKRMLIVLLAVTALVTACSSDGPETETGVATTSNDEITTWLGVAVPDSATDVQFEEVTGGIDDSALVRFSIPTNQVDGFVADLGIDGLQSGRQGFFYSSGPDWFQTADLQDFSGRSGTVDGKAIQVTADLSGGDTATVYILAAET